jgi:hypothetical protein
MFGKDPFRAGLEELGYTVEDLGANRLAFLLTVAAGRFMGREVKVGLEIPSDFNVTCPTGPHISPRLIPLNPGGTGNDRATETPNFGADWEYLSRPFGEQQQRWNKTKRTVKDYVRHVKRVLHAL